MPKITILIVEDETIVAEDLARKLERLGYGIAGTTALGEEAITLTRELQPSLVLMDILLAGTISGIEAAERIRRESDVPVVFLTALSDRATIERAKMTEPFGFILKPFENRELESHIEMALYKHQAERTLREREEWLRVTLKSIGDGVIATDISGKVTYMNPVAASMTGWTFEDAKSQPLDQVFRVINNATRQPAENLVARVLQEKRTIALANHTVLLNRGGGEMPVEDSAAPITDGRGRVIGVVIIFQDVTGKRRIEEELQKQAKELARANSDLTSFNRAMVGRELRMIELKKEVDQLCRQFGLPTRYEYTMPPGPNPEPTPPLP
jgi:two-component system, cell cycle sensor histidine kinase and response regulator CckA